jgi:glycerophosphoryl diester phosphodiesterase
VLVIAHRGASGTSPENTVVAFRHAVALGAHMIELDVQLTRDREVVVIHDLTLERTTDGRGTVRDHTLAEIQRLDAGAWFSPRFQGERVPALDQVLAAVPLPVNVELKPAGEDGLEERALGIVDAAAALDRVVFSSFDAEVLVRLRRRAPGARIAVLWESAPIAEGLALAGRVGATALHLRKDAVTTEAVAAATACHLPVRAWTVNDPDESARLAGRGIEGIFTDFPERFLHSERDE